MKSNFTPSINIIRDTYRDFYYIPTPNAKHIVSQLISDFNSGHRAFSLIGSYGTGKSSFLLALEQSLNNTKPFFNSQFINDQSIEIIKIVGSYTSIITSFADYFNLKDGNNISDAIFNKIFDGYHDIPCQSPLLFIVIDFATGLN